MAKPAEQGDPQDIVEIAGVRPERKAAPADRQAKRFLMIWFRCCHVYGRLYRNREQTRYEGRCPKCGAHVGAAIGEGGTDRRMFQAG